MKIAVILAALATQTSLAIGDEFLPERIWNRVVALTAADGNVLKGTKSMLCFVSAESSFGLGAVTNCIQEIPDGENSLWLMKQDIETKDRSFKNLIATYVERRKDKLPMAYYLELERDQFDQSGRLEATSYKVPCTMCHSSGPRLIRPTTLSLGRLEPREKTLLEQWNQKIAAYKIVETFVPTSEQRKRLVSENPRANEPLKLGSCLQCHNGSSGVRSSLTRRHAGMIRYLAFSSKADLGQAQMPAYGSPVLDAVDSACLKDWAAGGQPDGCGGKSKSVLPHPIEAHGSAALDLNVSGKKVIDGPASSVSVAVKTTFHDFEIHGLDVSGAVLLPNGDQPGVVSVSIGLDALDAGISARSQHTKGWLSVAEFPNIQVSSVISSGGSLPKRLTADVKIQGVSRQVDVAVECDSALFVCLIAPTTINLQDWGLKMPGFLGIVVKPEIEISGKIQFFAPTVAGRN